MTADDLQEAVFGATDGATTSVGLVATLWVSHHRSTIALAAAASGIAAAVSMAGGEYLADPDSSVRRAAVMGLATLVGALEPAVPFFVGYGGVMLSACIALTLILGGVVAFVRARTTGWTRAVAEVYGIFALVASLTTIAGLVAA
jgi:VIT family